ncbi:hypothetical protein PINS_up014516 [Pythium insidiosum]|nr:hypothetical protein PINS_up014516 [Pythium insidiosum]
MMMMHSTLMIVTGAERSVAELRLIFERASSPADTRMPIETVQIQEPVVAAEPEPELAESDHEPEHEHEHEHDVEQEAEPALELKNEHETENEKDNENESVTENKTENENAAATTAIKHESECEDATMDAHEEKTAPIVDDDAADDRIKTTEPLDPTSDTGSDSGSDVAVAVAVAVAPMPMLMPVPMLMPTEMPHHASNTSSKTRSLIRPPRVTRSAPPLASAPLQVNTSIARASHTAPEVREATRTMRHAKSNEHELARARQWRENKKALDSRVAAAKPRYMEYTTSSRYIAHREASVAQRQQSTRTNGTTRATTTRRSSA